MVVYLLQGLRDIYFWPMSPLNSLYIGILAIKHMQGLYHNYYEWLPHSARKKVRGLSTILFGPSWSGMQQQHNFQIVSDRMLVQVACWG